MHGQKQKRELPSLAIDLLPLIFIFIAALYCYRDFRFSKRDLIALFVFIILWCIGEYIRKHRYSDLSLQWQKRIFSHIKAYCSLIILEFVVLLYLPVPVIFWKQLITFTFGIVALDFLIKFLNIDVLTRDVGTPKHVIVAGTGSKAKIIEDQVLTSHNHEYQLKGFISCDNQDVCMIESKKVLGDLDNINQYLQSNDVDEIVIALPDEQKKNIQRVLTVADYHGIRVKYVLDYHELFGNHYKITRFGQVDAVNIRELPIDGKFAGFLKNSFDKVFAVAALIFLLPLFLIIALLIKLESPGPVFYCPIRIGKGGKAFKVFKFRSMRQNDDSAAGTQSTKVNDPRITRVGKFLRKYSIDELPQFINVVSGTMSVVGPRPHRRYLNRQLQENVYHYMLRQYVKPGITGWAQVNGWRGPTDTEEQKRQRTLHDLWYIENWSFRLDMKIIFLTLFSQKAHTSAF
ncbi:exopolysaccharide biosynthesis polyprenyl glycosylphosphotransferase [Niastella caeni]|uniref:Exopolysaccharide biosynthesis polyprenyl glycosylphosphotransferase n=1 Tax=Niastella caeni TaxID=2569763 RepID=A0A4S8HVX9_9BACT|nr:exopolysaccharide biosynthesis polyprenyl glycosylphosphotransferase [Niastella caeni]THU39351.1 exopolysaccharide biosynthesis polyprenyl glycosylphosphotransferase [Niastella caeni]